MGPVVWVLDDTSCHVGREYCLERTWNFLFFLHSIPSNFFFPVSITANIRCESFKKFTRPLLAILWKFSLLCIAALTVGLSDDLGYHFATTINANICWCWIEHLLSLKDWYSELWHCKKKLSIYWKYFNSLASWIILEIYVIPSTDVLVAILFSLRSHKATNRLWKQSNLMMTVLLFTLC